MSRRLLPALLVASLAVGLASAAGVLAFGAIPTALAFAAVALWLTADELADRATLDDPPPPATPPPAFPPRARGAVGPSTQEPAP